VVEIAEQHAQQIVVIALPLAVHSGELPPETEVDRIGDLQFIETAGDLPVPDARPLLYQTGGEGKVLVLAGEAVKGPGGAVQADGGMGIAVGGDQMDEPGEPGPGAGEKDVNGVVLCALKCVRSEADHQNAPFLCTQDTRQSIKNVEEKIKVF